MEHNQNTIAAINHQRAIRIKFYDHRDQSLKKPAVVEGLFWQSRTRFGGRFYCREV